MNKKNISYAALNKYLNSNEKVITEVEGLIGANNQRACILITGTPFDNNASFYKELNLIVVTNGCCKKLPLKPGYGPRVFLFNFNGNGNQIYVTIDSGGSGGFQFFYIFDYVRCDLNMIMSDDMFNAQYDNYTGSYLDCFRGQVRDNSNVWRIDLSCKGDDYLSQLYYEDGKLIEPKDIYISGANYTYPQFTQYYDRYTLLVYQRITGLYSADSLGYMETTLKFENGSHTVENVYLKTYDNKLTDCIVF